MPTVSRSLLVLAVLACAHAVPAGQTPRTRTISAPLSARPLPPALCSGCLPGEVLVQFEEGADEFERRAALERVQGLAVQELRVASPALPAEGHLLRARTALSVTEAVRRLREDPAVEFAEPVYRIRAAAVANDTYYASFVQWGMYSSDSPVAVGPAGTTNAFGSGAEVAWARGLVGRGDVYVGILDEGVAHLHPELSSAAWKNPFEHADGLDNDGNGYVHDRYG